MALFLQLEDGVNEPSDQHSVTFNALTLLCWPAGGASSL